MKKKVFKPYFDDDGNWIEPPRLVGKCDYCLSDMHKVAAMNSIGVYYCTVCNNPKRYNSINMIDSIIHARLIAKEQAKFA
jgi:hypothetical protein